MGILGRKRRTLAIFLLTGMPTLLWSASPTHAAEGERKSTPASVIVQLGAGDSGTDSFALGASWDLPWRYTRSKGELTAYVDVLLGQWIVDTASNRRASFTQFGVTPVLRWQTSARPGAFFIEAGVGANFVTPEFRNRRGRFGTRFTFGDHLGIGGRFGAGRRHEWALRIEHFSNGGIKQPNPGQDFLQLRYSYRLKP
jgi:lipid A 3-O-deacylase